MNSKAFTLVELAIVITIIGLLIGGVLKGQQLLENARVKSTVSQLRSYETAYTTFRDIYKAKPGDMANAASFLQNCATNCVSGNGDGMIGPADTNYAGDFTLAEENTQFWRHLALANLISGIDAQATSLAFGQSNPATPFGGGYTARQSRNTGGPETSDFDGFALRLHKVITGNGGSVEYNPLFAPRQIWMIDTMIDDGMPYSGSVRSSGADYNAPPCEVTYTPSNGDILCTGFYILE